MQVGGEYQCGVVVLIDGGGDGVVVRWTVQEEDGEQLEFGRVGVAACELGFG